MSSINKNVAGNCYMAPGKDQVAAGTRPRYCSPQAYNINKEKKMAKKLSKTLVAMFRNMFDSRSANEKYLAQASDLCDLEYRMKKLHTTMGRFGY